MYPRNAASPERLAIGAVVQISDGAVQTSGVSVKVMPQGGSASAGGGTIAYEEGIVHYLPTQAETNHTSFMLIAYKTGCIPASTTVVTTASTTPGTVLLAPTTHTSAVVPTVTTLTGHTAQTGDAFARLGAPAGASISVDIAAVKTQTAAIETDTQDIQSRLPAALVSGRIDASVGAMASGVLTATAIAADAITDAKVASDVTIASVTGSVGSVTGAVGSVTGNVGGNVTGSVGSVTGLTTSSIADQVWDEILSGHAGVGSAGAALAAAGGSGDPWATALPGAYGAGTAGQIVGDYLDAAVSSISGGSGLDAAGVRAAIGLASANLDTQLGTIDTVVDAILVDTAEIGAAGAGLTALASASLLGTVAGYLDTEIGAIKAKTDNLPASPAASSDCITAAGVRTAIGLASANLDTQLDALPTNAELATALGTADDAVLAAVAAAQADIDVIREYADNTVIRGTVSTGTTTSLTPSALSPAGVDADQFKGRIVVFDNDTTTAALRGQATDITASSAASLAVLTFTALTTAPQSGDTFSIV